MSAPPQHKNKRWNFEFTGCRVAYSGNGFDIGIGEKKFLLNADNDTLFNHIRLQTTMTDN